MYVFFYEFSISGQLISKFHIHFSVCGMEPVYTVNSKYLHPCLRLVIILKDLRLVRVTDPNVLKKTVDICFFIHQIDNIFCYLYFEEKERSLVPVRTQQTFCHYRK